MKLDVKISTCLFLTLVLVADGTRACWNEYLFPDGFATTLRRVERLQVTRH